MGHRWVKKEGEMWKDVDCGVGRGGLRVGEREGEMRDVKSVEQG